ncbi:Gfo/Idh/MocA family protein [Alkalicoccobacillus murimartini]|uniref:Dehydrogenase n=1 Tax=Alkalicoccobacillus murimartini TaxID=171685 RepID=A0ABT9YDS9_9BACI|nr:Gfo/Idh/MocA family oxidoreductase [Alkalicoccobacillus murimartini]MDQ0205347.1 putative dehydrogenase [Alkalicoccobacillus murimartini]
MVKVALLSKWHVHAKDYAREASEHHDIEIVAVWDEDTTRGQDWAEELQVEFESNLRVLLEREDLDGVIVDTPTNQHKEVIIAAAQAGKHIFTEKVLAFTASECEEIFDAIRENEVSLMLSLPRLNDPTYLYSQNALEEGLLGDLTSIRCRLEHGGAVSTDQHPSGWLPEHFYLKEQCGGGALIDLGAHPIYLTNRLAGEVESVMCEMGQFTGREVDDHATVITRHQSGVIGVIEAGFVASGSPFILELHGTKGSIIVEDRSLKIRSIEMGDGEWQSPKLPEKEESAMQQWVNDILHKQKPRITQKDMIDLTRINEAAKQSAEQGKRVSLR